MITNRGALLTFSDGFDAAFWQDFCDSYWNQEPVVIKNIEALSTDDELFFGMIETFRIQRSVNPNVMRFFIDDKQVETEKLEKWMPTLSDGGLDSFIKRIRRQLRGQKFCLNMSNLQATMPDTFYKLQLFLHGLYSRVGLPSGLRGVELEVFIGNYQTTPFGVHRDPGSVFCFPFKGLKKMRVWPGEALASKPKGVNKSRLMTGEKGDIIFWPHSYWHIAEGDGDVIISFSLVLFYDLPLKQYTLDLLKHIRVPPTDKRKHPLLTFPSTHLPKDLLKSLTSMKCSKAEIQEAEKIWLQRSSAYGFKEIPRWQKKPLQMNDRIRSQRGVPIQYRKIGNTLVVACSGKKFELQYNSGLVALIKKLNCNQELKVKSLCLEFSKRESSLFDRPKAAKAFLEVLYSSHGIEKMSGTDGT